MSENEKTSHSILVVDDDHWFREMLVARLGQEGWDVVEAATVAELFPLLEESPPDVLVLDHSMPGITGLDAARVLIRNDFEQPIVLFSAYLTPELKATCRELGIHPVDKLNGEELVVTCWELLEETAPVAAGSGPAGDWSWAQIEHGPSPAGA